MSGTEGSDSHLGRIERIEKYIKEAGGAEGCEDELVHFLVDACFFREEEVYWGTTTCIYLASMAGDPNIRCTPRLMDLIWEGFIQENILTDQLGEEEVYELCREGDGSYANLLHFQGASKYGSLYIRGREQALDAKEEYEVNCYPAACDDVFLVAKSRHNPGGTIID